MTKQELLDKIAATDLDRNGMRAIKAVIEAVAAKARKRKKTGKRKDRRAVETVTVPDLSAKKLLSAAKAQAGLTYVHPDYENLNLVRDERGKTYEVLTWKPRRGVSSDAVRKHFRRLGFTGNTAAFISRVAKNHPEGSFVTIPEDEWCFVYYEGLCVPSFVRDCLRRDLSLPGLAGVWGGGNVFVAFREIHK